MIAAFVAAAVAAAANAVPPVDRFPKAAASYLVAVDGKVVWERDADRPRLPASLTKMMTALVLVEGRWDPAAKLTISGAAARETGSRAGLRAGEIVAAGDLLAAMLVASANDACHALAEHAGPGVEAFVARMNAKARAMNLSATSFANPCGHDDPKQRSSARDLFAIADAAMARPEVAPVVAMQEAAIATSKGRRLTVTTGNQLLGRSAGVNGVKSGYTPGAGKCAAVSAERNGKKVAIVLLDAADRWWTAAALVEAAFE